MCGRSRCLSSIPTLRLKLKIMEKQRVQKRLLFPKIPSLINYSSSVSSAGCIPDRKGALGKNKERRRTLRRKKERMGTFIRKKGNLFPCMAGGEHCKNKHKSKKRCNKCGNGFETETHLRDHMKAPVLIKSGKIATTLCEV